MAKKYNVIDITGHSPIPLIQGMSLEEWDRWFNRNHGVIKHWVVMRDDRQAKDILVQLEQGAGDKLRREAAANALAPLAA